MEHLALEQLVHASAQARRQLQVVLVSTVGPPFLSPTQHVGWFIAEEYTTSRGDTQDEVLSASYST
jgi:hypothetical protein